MGKLHTIKKAILRNPSQFINGTWRDGSIKYNAIHYYKGKVSCVKYDWYNKSYRSFLKHILAGVGMSDNKDRASDGN